MALVLHRRVDETWLECARRQASQYGLEDDVETLFFEEMDREGMTEDQAAWNACYELDVLDYEPDDSPFAGREDVEEDLF